MKNAIIVGATSGIGLEVARIMRSEGVNIGVAGRSCSLIWRSAWAASTPSCSFLG